MSIKAITTASEKLFSQIYKTLIKAIVFAQSSRNVN